APSLQAGEIRQPIVRVNDVESLAPGDAPRQLRVAQDLGREVRSVVSDERRVGSLRDLPLLRVLELRRIGTQEGGDAAESEKEPFAVRRVVVASHFGGIDDLEASMR